MNTASILDIMTSFTALSPNGIVIVKPFHSFYGYPLWQNRKVGLRILNAGETAEAMTQVNEFSGISQEVELKIEIVARSLWAIDGGSVCQPEILEAYNKSHKTELTDLEYKRVMVRNFEYPVVEHLYTVYNDLQKKQMRKIFGIHECAITKDPFTDIPSGSKILLYSTSEIICPNGLAQLTPKDNFDFDETSQEVKEPPKNASDKPPETKVKTVKDFETYEQYQDYLVEKAEKSNEQVNV